MSFITSARLNSNNVLSQMPMDSVFHLDKAKKDLARAVHGFSRLGVRLDSSLDGGAIVHLTLRHL